MKLILLVFIIVYLHINVSSVDIHSHLLSHYEKEKERLAEENVNRRLQIILK